MSATTVSLNSTNFEDVPIVVSTAKKSIGYNENFQIELDAPIDRIQATFVESIQFPGTGYVINVGNNHMRVVPTAIFDFVFRNDFYTATELVDELNNRFSQYPTEIVFQYEWSYNNFTNLFTVSGGDTQINITNRSQKGLVGTEISTIVPLISFLNPDGPKLSTSTLPDPNNPGERTASSAYPAYETFTVQAATNIFSITTNTTVTTVTPTTTAGIDGFALATEIEVTINSNPNFSGFTVNYNTNNFSLYVRNNNDAVFDVFEWPVVFGGDIDQMYPPSNNYEFAPIHGTAPTHTITSGVNDTFTINEGSGDIDIILPEITNATLPELAIILQTAFNEANLLNKYEITFSSRTTLFRIKALKPSTSVNFPLWSLVINTASSIFGYTVAVNLQTIIKSDTNQFELFSSLSGDITMRQYTAVVLAPSSPVPVNAASALETAINNTLGTSYTVSYDVDRSTFVISGFMPFFILGTSELVGANNKIFGFLRDIGGFPAQGIALVYGPTYLYIKSNKLSEKKITTTSADPFYKNVIGKIILNKAPIQVVFNNFSISTVNKLAVKTSAQTIDFRLEDENGVPYYSNEIDWAFTIVFERF